MNGVWLNIMFLSITVIISQMLQLNSFLVMESQRRLSISQNCLCKLQWDKWSLQWCSKLRMVSKFRVIHYSINKLVKLILSDKMVHNQILINNNKECHRCLQEVCQEDFQIWWMEWILKWWINLCRDSEVWAEWEVDSKTNKCKSRLPNLEKFVKYNLWSNYKN